MANAADQRTDARASIEPGADGVLNTMVDPNDRSVGNTIVPGPDGVLDSVVDPADVVWGREIWDGTDRVCNSTAAGTDTQGHFDQGYAVSSTQPTTLDVVNEWQNLQIPLGAGGSSGAPLFSEEVPVAVLVAEAQRRQVGDLRLDSDTTFRTSLLGGTQVVVTYTLTNQGPHESVDPTVNLFVPDGLSVVACDAPHGGFCDAPADDRLSLAVDRLPLGSSATFELVFDVGCDVAQGEDLVLDAEVASRSIDPNDANDTLLDTVNVGYRLQDFGVLGTQRVLVEDRAEVLSAVGGYAAVGNAGLSITRIGVEARVGDVTSEATIELRDRSTTGDLISGRAIRLGNQVQTGARAPFSAVGPLPSLASDLPRAPGGTNLHLEPDQTGSLAADDHGNVHVKSRATLTLGAGTHTFTRLSIEPQAHLVVDLTEGPITLVVRDGMILRAPPTLVGGGAEDVLLVYQGTNALRLEAPFQGTVVADRALLELATRGPYTGGFYGKSVTIRPDVEVMHVPWCVTD